MELMMNAKIVFLKTKNHDGFYIRKVSAVKIEGSWKTICDTAELTLPRNVKDFDGKNVKDIFRRGDKVEIYLGYGMDEDLKLEFSGYIDKVSANYPIEIKLEDEMWRLKQLKVNFSAPNISLKAFIEKVVKDYPIDIDADVQLGAVRFSNVAFGEVLKKLQDDFSLYAFIRNGKLTVAKPYSDVTETVPSFDLERNCVSSSLNYLTKEERLVKIVGQSMQEVVKAVKAKQSDKKLKYEWGDENATDTINWTFNVKTLKDLETEVKRMYEQKKKDGFDGSFTTFGFPSLQHGQRLKLTSTLYPDREGEYYIDSVKKSFDNNGYRQEPELGPAYRK